jgi:hypothetical protein
MRKGVKILQREPCVVIFVKHIKREPCILYSAGSQ